MKRLRLALFALLGAVACNPGTPLAADGVVLLRWGHLEARPLGLFSGRLAYAGGCVGLESAAETVVVLWPPDTQFDESAGPLRVVVNGIPFAEGDQLQVGGGEYSDQAWAASLAGPIPPACQRDRYVLATELVVD